VNDSFDQEYQDYLNNQEEQQLKDDKTPSDSTPSKTPKVAARCRLAKCCICIRGIPESFAQSKPVSWLSVCRLAMWALTQDGIETGRKWFSLGRDICPFVESHRHMCGRDFTVNWKTTIGITMSTYCKKGNFFLSGNSNEHGLGFYSLPDDSQDPYLVTGLQPGRVYRSPSSALIQVDQELNNTNGTAKSPETPVRKRKKTAFPGDAPSTPPATTPSPPSSTSRDLKERKHTTDLEKQMLLDYYDKYGTNTTSPEYTALQTKLGWDHHRTKIWLYNRKTYHQKPGGFEEKRKKKRQRLTDEDEVGDNNNSNDVNNSKSDLLAGHDDDSEDELMYGDDNGRYNDDDIESLRNRLRLEMSARKNAITQCVMKDEQIASLEASLTTTNPNNKLGNADEEISMLRKQVDMYCKELREEKRKRGEQEVRAFDYLAQINALKLRNVQLEKLLQQRKEANGSIEVEEIETNFVHVAAGGGSGGEKVAVEGEGEKKETTV